MTDTAGLIGIAVGLLALGAAIWGAGSSYARRNTQFEDHCQDEREFRQTLEKRLCKIDELEKESKETLKRLGEVEGSSKLAVQKADLLWNLLERHAGRLIVQSENPLTSEERARIVSGDLTVEQARQIVAGLEREIECGGDAPHQVLVHILVEAHVKRLMLDKHGVRL